MGALRYPVRGMPQVDIDDRTLAHLQAIIGAKMRLRQSFFFSWTEPRNRGSGRTSIWIDSTIELIFVYATRQRCVMNREWLESMMMSANSVDGLELIAEVHVPAQSQLAA